MLKSNDSAKELMKIGELAERLGTTTRTIRYYEEEGLISPVRSPKGIRLYAPKDEHRLQIALRLARLGVSLDTLKKLALTRPACATGAESSAQISPYLNDLRRTIHKQTEELAELQRDLERADMLIRQCADCPNRPDRQGCPRCPVERNIDKSDLARLIWDPATP